MVFSLVVDLYIKFDTISIFFLLGLSGLYRKHGSHRYAQMPAGTYANSPANLMATPPKPIPFSENFGQASSMERSAPVPEASPGTLPPQPSIGQLHGMGYVPNATGILFLHKFR